MSERGLRRKLDRYLSLVEIAIEQEDQEWLNNLIHRIQRRAQGAMYEGEVSTLCYAIAEEKPDIGELRLRANLIIALHREDYSEATQMRDRINAQREPAKE